MIEFSIGILLFSILLSFSSCLNTLITLEWSSCYEGIYGLLISTILCPAIIGFDLQSIELDLAVF